MRGALYPNMTESPRYRWAFIRKVYSIVALQLLLTTAVVPSMPKFLASAAAVSIAVITLLAASPVVMVPMVLLRRRHPWNLMLLLLFSICVSSSVGVVCLATNGNLVMTEASALTSWMVIFFTLSTFWYARRGYDFRCLWPILYAALVVLFVLLAKSLVQGDTADYRGLAAAVFSCFIMYDTDNLIKRHSYDEYVLAAASLYLDIVNLFMAYRGSLSVQMVEHA